jgi:hypothetical protein
MRKRNSINWKEIGDELERAPDDFLLTASELWRGRQAWKRRKQRQKSGVSALDVNARKDAEQQTLWKAAYDAVTDEFLFFGEFKDKGEHIRLLQPVRVVKCTAKQIHIVAAYTLYYAKTKLDSAPVVWSASPTGGLFGNIYKGWRPVRRYRLRQIAKAGLYTPDVLEIPQEGESSEERSAYIQAWKRLCRVCLFANEDEYARWHIVRYEDKEDAEAPYPDTNGFQITTREPFAILNLSLGATQTQIKAAYKRMAMKHHPDRGGSAAEFQKVRSAYEVLRRNR